MSVFTPGDESLPTPTAARAIYHRAPMPRARRLLTLLAALTACDGAAVTPPRDAAPPDAGTDVPSVALTDAPPTPPPDVPPAALADVPPGPVDAPAACAAPEASELLRALRATRPAGVSAVAAPGQRFDDLRAPFDAAPVARTLLAQARTSSRRTVPTLAAGSSAAYQTVASLALAAALVAWHDRDVTAARTALGALAACAITPEWLRGAPEIPIYLGASLVDLAAAADLLAASPLPTDDIALGRAHLGRAVASVAAWLQSGGLLYMAVHNDNHGMRLGAGLAAASMLAPAVVVDEVLGYALALMDRSVAQQTGGAQGWAEGTTYFAYGFESAAPALYAVDRAWTGPDARCVSCPGHRLAPCARAPRRVTRPSRDNLLRDVLRWGASMETPGGWLVPTDDSRLMGAPSPLFERVLGATAYTHWSPTGPTGSTGGSVNVGPLVALALASPPLTERLPRVDRWPAAGTGRIDAGEVAAFLNAEPETARQGVGHERPDVLALHVVVGDALVLGGSGYRDYDGRAPYARADAASVITVEGILPRDLGAAEAGPVASMRADGPLAGSFSQGGVTVTRALTWEGDALVVEDRVEVTGEAREVAWHWHLRGALDPAAWTWSVGGARCAATQTGVMVETTRESAPHYDDYSRMETHPVLRQRARLVAGAHTLRTRVTCARAP